jgi:hypothetical protein
MNLNVPTERYTVPTAFVTKGRQRVKQYNNTTVYLNNREEFEIELFNPTPNKVLAKIDLNGISIGPGVVLRPGERVFLERYLNEARKFLFETYEVDGNNGDVQRAIANNGDVAIKFYCETPPPIPYVSPTIWTTTYWPPITYPTYPYYSHTGNPTFGTLNNTGTVKGASSGTFTSSNSRSSSFKSRKLSKQSNFSDDFSPSNECLYSASVGYAGGASMDFMDMEEPAAPTKSMETGRIEKGSNSNQSFGYDYSSFNAFWSWRTEWKILPMSQKPLVQEDLKIYCSSCGRRRKKSENYCPVCGCKY